MSEPHDAVFDTTSWDEKPIADAGISLKVTRARTERTFKGQLEGKGVAEYVMVYHQAPPGVTDPHKMTATYTGLLIFKGKFDGSEEGEAIFTTNGTHGADGAIGNWIADPKATSGGLKGLTGTGRYVSVSMEGTKAWLNMSLSG